MIYFFMVFMCVVRCLESCFSRRILFSVERLALGVSLYPFTV